MSIKMKEEPTMKNVSNVQIHTKNYQFNDCLFVMDTWTTDNQGSDSRHHLIDIYTDEGKYYQR